jgi:transcriptional regulator with XRE-family HTH domain
MTIRDRIRQVLDENPGWSVREVSLRAGSDSLLHKVLNPEKRGGIKSPTIDTLENIARALGVSPSWLAFGVEDNPLPSESDLEEMIEAAMRELPVGVTYSDYPSAVASGLRSRLRRWQVAGGSVGTEAEETSHDKGAPPPAPTKRPSQK